MVTTYETLLLEDVLALCRELDGQYRDFPAVIAPAYFGACSSSQNLVSEADSDDSNAILGQDLVGEIDEFQYPWVASERVVFYMA